MRSHKFLTSESYTLSSFFYFHFPRFLVSRPFPFQRLVYTCSCIFLGVYIYTYDDCGRRDLMQRPWRGMTQLITVSYFWDRFVVQDHAKHLEPFCVELWWKSHCHKEVMIHTQKKICCRIKILHNIKCLFHQLLIKMINTSALVYCVRVYVSIYLTYVYMSVHTNKIPVASSPCRLNSVRWRLSFVDSQWRT
jgi:hypothetical protein